MEIIGSLQDSPSIHMLLNVCKLQNGSVTSVKSSSDSSEMGMVFGIKETCKRNSLLTPKVNQEK